MARESAGTNWLGVSAARTGLATVPALRSLPVLVGMSVPVTYVFFGLLAYLYYPTSFNPVRNTISELGNRHFNPHGASFYIAGCALTGSLVVVYFGVLGPWRWKGTGAQDRLLLLVRALGVVGGFALVMNAVYPQDQLGPHHFWSGVVFNSMGAALFLSLFALRRPGRSNLLLNGAALLASVAVVVMFTFARQHWLEWVTVSLFLVASCMVGVSARTVTISE